MAGIREAGRTGTIETVLATRNKLAKRQFGTSAVECALEYNTSSHISLHSLNRVLLLSGVQKMGIFGIKYIGQIVFRRTVWAWETRVICPNV